MKHNVWTGTALVAGAALYVVALSNEVYALTSPPAFSWHVLLRKVYSVAAFALLGYLAGRAVREHGGRASFAVLAATVAAYSLAIEIGQAVAGSHEGLVWQSVDVLCGALGGLLGGVALRGVRPRPVRGPRRH